MAAIDFPNSPSNGDTFVVGTTTYSYNGTKGYWDAAPTGSSIVLTAVGTHIIPTADVTYDLGSTTKKWRYLYGASLYLGTQQITPTATGIQAAGLTIGTATDNVKLTLDASSNIIHTATVGGTEQTATRNITYTDLSVGAEPSASGDGSIAYDNTTGEFIFTPADTSSLAPLASPTLTGTPLAPTASAATNTTQIATTAFVTGAVSTAVTNLVNGAPAAMDTLNELSAALNNDAALNTTLTNSIALKAPLASPTLTGVPLAPTASAATNTTQIATTAFVTDAVSTAVTNLVNGAPAALDTLNEIASALNNDAALNTTLTNSIALKAPLASPTLTGVPLAPTPSLGTSNTQIATTAFVAAELVNGSYAPIASPAFTGTPTSSTATAGDSSTQIANTEFVQGEISTLIGGAPASLNTLNELAAALGDDSNYASSLVSSLALKAPIDSPGFTGTPTVPSVSVGTNTTQIATAELVVSSILGKANLDSPALAGTPTSTTPAAADSSTKIATTAFIQNELNTSLVGKSDLPVVTVTVAGGKFLLDGTSQQTAFLSKSTTYRFDQSDATNGNHPLRFSTDSGNSSAFTTGVTEVGTPGSAGAYTQIVVDKNTPGTLYYYCGNHSGMGGQAVVESSVSSISLNALKAAVAASSDFADFQTRIANL